MKKRYAIGILNFFDNDNKVYIVESETPESAMIEVVKLSTPDRDEKYQVEYRKSLEGLSVTEIQSILFDTDVAISTPVEI